MKKSKFSREYFVSVLGYSVRNLVKFHFDGRIPKCKSLDKKIILVSSNEKEEKRKKRIIMRTRRNPLSLHSTRIENFVGLVQGSSDSVYVGSVGEQVSFEVFLRDTKSTSYPRELAVDQITVYITGTAEIKPIKVYNEDSIQYIFQVQKEGLYFVVVKINNHTITQCPLSLKMNSRLDPSSIFIESSPIEYFHQNNVLSVISDTPKFERFRQNGDHWSIEFKFYLRDEFGNSTIRKIEKRDINVQLQTLSKTDIYKTPSSGENTLRFFQNIIEDSIPSYTLSLKVKNCGIYRLTIKIKDSVIADNEEIIVLSSKKKNEYFNKAKMYESQSSTTTIKNLLRSPPEMELNDKLRVKSHPLLKFVVFQYYRNNHGRKSNVVESEFENSFLHVDISYLSFYKNSKRFFFFDRWVFERREKVSDVRIMFYPQFEKEFSKKSRFFRPVTKSIKKENKSTLLDSNNFSRRCEPLIIITSSNKKGSRTNNVSNVIVLYSGEDTNIFLYTLILHQQRFVHKKKEDLKEMFLQYVDWGEGFKTSQLRRNIDEKEEEEEEEENSKKEKDKSLRFSGRDLTKAIERNPKIANNFRNCLQKKLRNDLIKLRLDLSSTQFSGFNESYETKGGVMVSASSTRKTKKRMRRPSQHPGPSQKGEGRANEFVVVEVMKNILVPTIDRIEKRIRGYPSGEKKKIIDLFSTEIRWLLHSKIELSLVNPFEEEEEEEEGEEEGEVNNNIMKMKFPSSSSSRNQKHQENIKVYKIPKDEQFLWEKEFEFLFIFLKYIDSCIIQRKFIEEEHMIRRVINIVRFYFDYELLQTYFEYFMSQRVLRMMSQNLVIFFNTLSSQSQQQDKQKNLHHREMEDYVFEERCLLGLMKKHFNVAFTEKLDEMVKDLQVNIILNKQYEKTEYVNIKSSLSFSPLIISSYCWNDIIYLFKRKNRLFSTKFSKTIAIPSPPKKKNNDDDFYHFYQPTAKEIVKSVQKYEQFYEHFHSKTLRRNAVPSSSNRLMMKLPNPFSSSSSSSSQSKRRLIWTFLDDPTRYEFCQCVVVGRFVSGDYDFVCNILETEIFLIFNDITGMVKDQNKQNYVKKKKISSSSSSSSLDGKGKSTSSISIMDNWKVKERTANVFNFFRNLGGLKEEEGKEKEKKTKKMKEEEEEEENDNKEEKEKEKKKKEEEERIPKIEFESIFKKLFPRFSDRNKKKKKKKKKKKNKNMKSNNNKKKSVRWSDEVEEDDDCRNLNNLEKWMELRYRKMTKKYLKKFVFMKILKFEEKEIEFYSSTSVEENDNKQHPQKKKLYFYHINEGFSSRRKIIHFEKVSIIRKKKKKKKKKMKKKKIIEEEEDPVSPVNVKSRIYRRKSEGTMLKILNDRKYAIDARICSIMKKLNKCENSVLTKMIMDEYSVHKKVVKKRVDSLVEREYIRRTKFETNYDKEFLVYIP